ncbi:MAG: M1 family metallopeptidase [Thermoflavifilum sp.]|nr:M1 family metallopeptidase [Thermoflavifilum sp.]
MHHKIFSLFFCCNLCYHFAAHAQTCYWQQRVHYTIHAHLNVHTNRLNGNEHIVYENHSPDTLREVFFHLYWNAFQPGSMMDVHSREAGKIILGVTAQGDTMRDWDSRVRDRIAHLKPDEIGYDSVTRVAMNGVPQPFKIKETILQVHLTQPILPHQQVSFDVDFKTQVNIQIRRSGRDNAEGVRYSMSQWYPKLCEYDRQGWHPTPYVGREFYGVWGDYEVWLTLDKHYVVAATGYLQNPNEIGYGYEKPGTTVKRPAGDELTWHFVAPNVHDFVWAADPDYVHLVDTAHNAAHTAIHVFFKKDSATLEAWHNLLKAAVRVLPFMEAHFGPYPFHQYSFIQGGDGGMEYPMATLIKGPSLGTAFHEWMHSWYQMMLGTNESLYPWMDEGFTTWAEGKVSNYYYHRFADSIFKDAAEKKAFLERLDTSLPQGEASAYRGYVMLVKSGLAEPMTTHADHYETNFAYTQNAYSKGAVFLEQLGYIIGDSLRDKTLLNYYWQWRFKHPTADDFIHVAEQTSHLKLDWYQEYWIQSTKTIDYAIANVQPVGDSTSITLQKIGQMPMPIDVLITCKNGKQQLIYIPLDLMFGEKPVENPSVPRHTLPAWHWTDPTYHFSLPVPFNQIRSIIIDPSRRMADINLENNMFSHSAMKN